MTNDNDSIGHPAPGKARGRGSPAKPPGWANGLRKLYDSVVTEPLPDSFEDLLQQLDRRDDG